MQIQRLNRSGSRSRLMLEASSLFFGTKVAAATSASRLHGTEKELPLSRRTPLLSRRFAGFLASFEAGVESQFVGALPSEGTSLRPTPSGQRRHHRPRGCAAFALRRGSRPWPNPLARSEHQRRAVRPAKLPGIFSASRACRPTVVVRLALTLGSANSHCGT